MFLHDHTMDDSDVQFLDEGGKYYGVEGNEGSVGRGKKLTMYILPKIKKKVASISNSQLMNIPLSETVFEIKIASIFL